MQNVNLPGCKSTKSEKNCHVEHLPLLCPWLGGPLLHAFVETFASPEAEMHGADLLVKYHHCLVPG